jgi:hypothetical protein
MVIGNLKRVASTATKVIKDPNVQQNVKKIAPASASLGALSTVLETVSSIATSLTGSPKAPLSVSSEIEPAQAAQLAKTISDAASEMILNENGEVTDVGMRLVNGIANTFSGTLRYIVAAPMHVAYQLFRNIPISIWKGVTLQPIKSDVITNGSDVIIYIGQDASGQLIIKAGQALITIVKITVIKGIITIIIIYVIYRVTKYTINKTFNYINKGKNAQGIEEYEMDENSTY